MLALLLIVLVFTGLAMLMADRLRIWLRKRELRRLLGGRPVALVLDDSRYGYERLFCEDEGSYWIYDKTREGYAALVLRVDSELDAQIWILRHGQNH